MMKNKLNSRTLIFGPFELVPTTSKDDLIMRNTLVGKLLHKSKINSFNRTCVCVYVCVVSRMFSVRWCMFFKHSLERNKNVLRTLCCYCCYIWLWRTCDRRYERYFYEDDFSFTRTFSTNNIVNPQKMAARIRINVLRIITKKDIALFALYNDV